MPDPEPLPALLAEMRALDAKATPGPWDTEGGKHGASVRSSRTRRYVAKTTGLAIPKAECDANADLIAALRNALPRLLRELERKDAVVAIARRMAAGGSQFTGMTWRQLDAALAAHDAGEEESDG